MTPLLRQLRWEGKRHQVAAPSLQERRVRRLLRIAGRIYAYGPARVLDDFNSRAIELHGSQPEPNQAGLRKMLDDVAAEHAQEWQRQMHRGFKP